MYQVIETSSHSLATFVNLDTAINVAEELRRQYPKSRYSIKFDGDKMEAPR